MKCERDDRIHFSLSSVIMRNESGHVGCFA